MTMGMIKVKTNQVSGFINPVFNNLVKKGGLVLTSILLSVSASSSVYAAGAVVGDAAAGKTKSASCAGCHGADGNSGVPSFPKLAGQGAKYIAKQLNDVKSGARPILEMAGLVQGLSEQDIQDLAAYYAGQTSTMEGVSPDLKPLGETIYRAGNAETGLPACGACHGASGGGVPAAGFPKLGGQHAVYTANQLKAFRAAGREDAEGKRRTNDGESKMMRSVAMKMSDKEIEAVANYVSGLHD